MLCSAKATSYMTKPRPTSPPAKSHRRRQPGPSSAASLRAPLSELNPSPTTSADTPRGCFRFLKNRPTSAPRSRSPEKTSEAKFPPGRSRSRERAPRFCVVDTSQPRRRKAPSFSSQGSARRTDLLGSDEGKGSGSDFSFNHVLEAGRRVPAVSDTPAVAKPAVATVSTPETATPPLNASVSPEIPAGSSLMPSDCYGTGHLLAGVADRRKCKARNWIEVEKDSNFDEVGGSVCDSLAAFGSVVTPPPYFVPKSVTRRRSLGFEGLVEPSKLVSDETPPSSGYDTKNCEDLDCKVSNGGWPLSRSKRSLASSPGDDLVHDAAHSSPEFEGFVDASAPFAHSSGSSLLPVFYNNRSRNSFVDSVNRNETSVEKIAAAKKGVLWPSSSVSKTPTNCLDDYTYSSSTRRTSNASNLSGVLTPLEEKRCQLYLSTKTTSLQANSHSGNNKSSTSKAISRLGGQPRLVMSKNAQFPYQCQLNSSADASKTVKFPLPNPNVSICSDIFLSSTPTQAISCRDSLSSSFRGSRSKTDNIFYDASELRISWRDGLVSRIYEMEESDCQWSSEEEEFDHLKSELRLSFAPVLKSSILIDDDINSEDDDIQLMRNNRPLDSFYMNQMAGEKKSFVSSSKSFPLAESISIEDGSLVASDNSDWTICYKNQLFK